MARLINRVIQSGVRDPFMEREGHDSTGWIRAQYRRKPPTIEIYKPSLKQLGRFFRQSGYHVNPDDLIALHLYHEWFHHLESSSLGRTDHRLPKAEKKRWGPLVFRRRIHRLREIAAHAFTQSDSVCPGLPCGWTICSCTQIRAGPNPRSETISFDSRRNTDP